MAQSWQDRLKAQGCPADLLSDPTKALAWVSERAEQLAAQVRTAEAGVTFAVSSYPGAVEIKGLGFGWMNVRADAHKVLAFMDSRESFAAFVKANESKLRQSDTDSRFDAERSKVKDENKLKKALKG